MKSRPVKIQGTDGIRGGIAGDDQLGGKTPVEYFLSEGRLTPAFFERYTYAFATLLLRSGFAGTAEEIVVGWDPRDEKGLFNEAAINGIRKAGLNVLVTGVLPTPAIPLYMLSVKSPGCVVLTASHNPSDQNGIKLFFGHTALKFLPPDDRNLTSIIYEQESLDMESRELKGAILDHTDRARSHFIGFSRNPANSWLEGEDFSDTILVIDASKGAIADIAEDIFSAFPFREIIYTNIRGNINERCGVADIEGLETIRRADVIHDGAKFSSYETLEFIFHRADELDFSTPDAPKLTGLVFDGDGDRCFRLDYHPGNDEILVSSGDLLGIHQAKYLMGKGLSQEPVFANTVESDLNTAITARKLGYTPRLTGVGDKWILLQAIMDYLQSYTPDNLRLKDELNAVLNDRDESYDISAYDISMLWKNTLKEASYRRSNRTRFVIGFEESGHCITASFYKDGKADYCCFMGNGIKTGLNSLVSMKRCYGHLNPEEWYRMVAQPFEAGIRKTFYTYYVDKNRILPGSVFRKEVNQSLIDLFSTLFPTDFMLNIITFPEEREMLYGSILDQGNQVGAVFIRNSGTEDKTALYLRGEQRLAPYLKSVGDQLHLKLLLGMKQRPNPFVSFQVKIMKALESGDALQTIIEDYPEVPSERVFKEIEFKEGLLSRGEGRLALSEKGRRFLELWIDEND